MFHILSISLNVKLHIVVKLWGRYSCICVNIHFKFKRIYVIKRHDIAKILLQLTTLNTNQSINHVIKLWNYSVKDHHLELNIWARLNFRFFWEAPHEPTLPEAIHTRDRNPVIYISKKIKFVLHCIHGKLKQIAEKFEDIYMLLDFL